MHTLIALAVLLAHLPQSGTDVRFTTELVEVPWHAKELIAVDFDNDGIDTLVSVVEAPALARIDLAQDGSVALNSIPITGAEDIDAGDLMGSGRLDLIVAGTAGLSVLPNSGANGVGAPIWLDLQEHVAVALVDLDADGQLDVVAIQSTGVLRSWRADGAGGFQQLPGRFMAHPLERRLEVADWNGDGRGDVLVREFSLPRLVVALGDGGGGFASSATVPLSSTLRGLCVGDFDQDGNEDFAHVTNHGGLRPVQYGDGAGGFEGGPWLSGLYASVAPADQALVSGDLDGDGFTDLVIADRGPHLLRWNGSRSPGRFSSLACGPTDVIARAHLSAGGAASVATIGRISGGTARSRLNLLHPGGTDVGARGVRPLSRPLGWLLASYSPSQVTSAYEDLDGDGSVDAVTSGQGLYAVHRGGPQAWTIQDPLPLDHDALGIGLIDVAGDSEFDLVSWGPSGEVCVRVGSGDGVFAASPQRSAVFENKPHVIDFGDMDGDGLVDVAGASQTSPGVTIHAGDGGGGFGAAFASVPLTGTPAALELADVDGDGRLDVLLAQNTGGLKVLLNSGQGTFTTVFAARESTGFLQAAAFADINGDGLLDVVWTTTARLAWVALQSGPGQFSRPRTTRLGGHFHTIVVGDLNGDGREDLVLGGFGAGVTAVVRILLGTSGGEFEPGSLAGASSLPVDVEDVDGDGRADVLLQDGALLQLGP